MKKFLFTAFFIPVFVFSQTQQKCGNSQYLNKNKNLKTASEQTINDIYETIKIKTQSDTILKIPVVVHVVYENTQENINDSLILNQIEVLNRDYRRQNPDTINTRSVFDSLAVDTKIEFCLATTDPFGQPTSGITRTQTTETSFIDLSFNLDKVKSSTTGGKDAWPVDKYLNIWVCDLSINILGTNAPFVLGFAYPPVGAPNWPPGSTPTNQMFDGVVVHYEVFGENNPLSTLSFSGITITANKGRICVHEVGHYLGLRHIWGDGDCSQDDGILDTPKSDSQSDFQCDFTKNSCLDLPFDFPDMIENYMDYSSEDCQNSFTKGQKNIMRTSLETIRLPLISGSCSGGATNIEKENSFIKVYPNPSNGLININSDIKIEEIEGFSIEGKKLFYYKPNTKNTNINCKKITKGIIFIKIKNKKETILVKQIIK